MQPSEDDFILLKEWILKFIGATKFAAVQADLGGKMSGLPSDLDAKASSLLSDLDGKVSGLRNVLWQSECSFILV
ncbi:hypothetical protein AC249_AIPGENE11536 [Exaiptasia diaphana]|nr:hypothetical protein AC249_AIPGENE11536 [Exaiptasia diaphana]